MDPSYRWTSRHIRSCCGSDSVGWSLAYVRLFVIAWIHAPLTRAVLVVGERRVGNKERATLLEAVGLSWSPVGESSHVVGEPFVRVLVETSSVAVQTNPQAFLD